MIQPPARPARADSIRNRANILEAARRQITLHGPQVGMDQIAKSAGVAVGTLYRHFPTKTDLVAAVVGEFVTSVAGEAESAVRRVNEGSPALDELSALLTFIVLAAATNQAAKAAAEGLNATVNDSEDVQRAGVAVSALIGLAQLEGAVRGDLSAEDFYLLVSNVPPDQPPAALQRWIDLILFGIVGPAGG